MDIFSTTITVVQEIYTITVFVRGVVVEMKGYEENVSDIQAKLEHEFIFLETFKALFFDENASFQQYKSLPLNLTRDVDNILLSLQKCLAQYGLLAAKHGLNLAEPLALIQPTETAIAEAPTVADPAEPRNGFRGRLKASFQTLKKKLEPLDWALFSKDKIIILLKDYSEWTERLRQVMTLMLLVAGSIRDSTKKELVGKPVGAALRLDEVSGRQIRAQTGPPAYFSPLDGDLNIANGAGSDRSTTYWNGSYDDSSGFGATPIIVEEHRYGMEIPPSDHMSADEKRMKQLEPIRSLAWLLKGDESSTQSRNSPQNSSSMYTLECLGYLDRSAKQYPVLVYQVPALDSGSAQMTLHDFIEKTASDFAELQLGHRFFLAWALASTLYNVHSSGWVHKGIWSRGILVFPRGDQKDFLIPYLCGWAVARPQTMDYRMRSANVNQDGLGPVLEPNLYRHPERYNKPIEGYKNEHDIYALGVVLLEIGLWKTMSAHFAKPIAFASSKRDLPPVSLKHNRLLELSRSPKLKQEMGSEYAEVVERCLTSAFEVERDDEKSTALISKFHTLVVKPLNYGISL